MRVRWPSAVAERSTTGDSSGRDAGMRALLIAASFLSLWAGTAMLLSRLPWCHSTPRCRDSVSPAERLAPYAPDIEPCWTYDVERWLDTVGDAESP